MSLIRQIKSILIKNDAASLPVEKPARTERRRQKRHSHKGRKILIIDDSPTIVASLGKILRSAGCLITEAGDAESGIEIARTARPDVIFLDIVLPGINGFAALRQMRKEEATRHIPVVMISGNEQATEQFYAKRIGADDFMKKPFSRHEVFTRLEALIAQGKLPQLEAEAASTAVQPPDLLDERPDAPAPRIAANTADLPLETIASLSPLQARQQLAAMGLQYFSQEQFAAAVKRADKLAVDLFIIGGGVEIRT